MSGALPDLLDPWRAVRVGAVFDGTLAAGLLVRVREVVESLGGTMAPEIDYKIRFERRPDGLPVVSGHLSASVTLICQRCLSDLEFHVDAPIALALVRSEDAARDLPPEFDPLVLTDDAMRPLDLIEDEVLLCIPSVPRHEQGACTAVSLPGAGDQVPSQSVERSATEASTAERPNPFALLTALKRD